MKRCTTAVSTTRRRLIGLGGLFACGALRPDPVLSSIDNAARFEPRFITASRSGSAQFSAVLLDETGSTLARLPLPARAHGVATHRKRGIATVFARRPGRYLCCFDLHRSAVPQFIAPRQGRHFYGHGVYSDDGQHLLATENNIESGRGVIGIYHVDSGYQRVGELDSRGVGPHDIITVPGAGLLVVANGGIQTHPDHGREKLNIPSMRPSIAVFDAHHGELMAFHQLPDSMHKLSLRHLALSRNGNVWFAGQYEGDDGLPESLAGSIDLAVSLSSFKHGRSAGGLRLLSMPQTLIKRSKGYLSSVAVQGDTVLFTTSRGGFAFLVNDISGSLVDTLTMLDCSGVAAASRSQGFRAIEPGLSGVATSPSGAAFIMTSGTGEIRFLPDWLDTPADRTTNQWDNHIYSV